MSFYPTYSDVQLLSLLKNGDESAFEQFYARYRQEVYFYALRICNHVQSAEEIVQNVMLKIWQRREQIDINRNFKGWITKIATNEAFDFLKRLSGEAKLKANVWKEMQSLPAYSEDNYLLKEYLSLIEKAICALPTQQQKIFRLSRERNLTYDEIAAQLQISSHTVRNHMAGALDNLRKLLHDHVNGVMPVAVAICIVCGTIA